MAAIKLNIEPLTAENFKPFGEVVGVENKDYITINQGYAKKYPNLVHIDSKENNGTTALHIYQAKQRNFPLTIHMLEQHPFFSQMFLPRLAHQFLSVVAPPGAKPEVEKIQAFITNGKQGVNYYRGVWHFPLISLIDGAEFLVIDRVDQHHAADKGGAGTDIEQCIEVAITDDQIIIENNPC